MSSRRTKSSELADLTRRLIAFRDERDWRRFHSLKNLIGSVSLEAAELLETVQWRDDREVETAVSDPTFRAKVGEECADILLYLLLICERAGIDLLAAANDKIDKNAAKYPVEKARGNARKYTEF